MSIKKIFSFLKKKFTPNNIIIYFVNDNCYIEDFETPYTKVLEKAQKNIITADIINQELKFFKKNKWIKSNVYLAVPEENARDAYFYRYQDRITKYVLSFYFLHHGLISYINLYGINKDNGKHIFISNIESSLYIFFCFYGSILKSAPIKTELNDANFDSIVDDFVTSIDLDTNPEKTIGPVSKKMKADIKLLWENSTDLQRDIPIYIDKNLKSQVKISRKIHYKNEDHISAAMRDFIKGLKYKKC